MWLKRRNQKFHTPLSYFLGDRELPPVATAISLFMSFSPLVLITDFPVEIYNRGATPFLRCFGQSAGILFAAIFFVPMLFRLKLVTTYEYAEKRYQVKALRYTSSIVAIVVSIINSALVTYSLCQSLIVVTPLPIWLAAVLVSAKATFSAGAGGIQSVVWTNVVHFLTMFCCLTAVVVMSFKNFENGMSEAWTIAAEGGRLNFLGDSLDPRHDFTIWTAIFPAMFHYIGLMLSQKATSRYTSFPTLSRCVFAVISVIPQTIALHVLLLFLAVVMFSSYWLHGCDPAGLGRAHHTSGLTSHYIKDFLEDKYPGIVGAWMVTLMASTLSSLSASVNASVGLIWHDFIGDYLEDKIKDKTLPKLLKLVTICIGLVTLGIALLMWRLPPSYVRLIAKCNFVLAASFYLVHFAGALIPFVNRPGVILAIVITFSTTISLTAVQYHFGYHRGPAPLDRPIRNCEGILANMTATGTTPICNHTTVTTMETTPFATKVPGVRKLKTKEIAEMSSTTSPTTTSTTTTTTTTSTSTSTTTSTTTSPSTTTSTTTTPSTTTPKTTQPSTTTTTTTTTAAATSSTSTSPEIANNVPETTVGDEEATSSSVSSTSTSPTDTSSPPTAASRSSSTTSPSSSSSVVASTSSSKLPQTSSLTSTTESTKSEPSNSPSPSASQSASSSAAPTEEPADTESEFNVRARREVEKTLHPTKAAILGSTLRVSLVDHGEDEQNSKFDNDNDEEGNSVAQKKK